MTDATLWSWVLRLADDLRAAERGFPFVIHRIELDGRRVVRNHAELLPRSDDTLAGYLERVRRQTRRAVSLAFLGAGTASWDLLDAALPALRRPGTGHLDLRIVVRDRATPASDDPIVFGDDQLALRARIEPAAGFDATRALRNLLEEACMASVRDAELMNGGSDVAIARLRFRLSDGAALEARLEAHRLSWETGHGLERTPALRIGTCPEGARLTVKCPEAIALSVVGSQAVLASWGHTFEISQVAPWMEDFIVGVRGASAATSAQLCCGVPDDDHGLARDLVDALWSANAFEVEC